MSLALLVALLIACGTQAPRPGPPDADGDGWPAVGAERDCDDGDPGRHPGAAERCDGIDGDCDGRVDEGAVDALAGYADTDGDGYGGAAVVACEVTPGGDCDDADASIHPSAEEVCDGLDNDCDGLTDAGAVDAQRWFFDGDFDGYGDPEVALAACAAPAGFIADAGDCDDRDADTHPGAPEVCDGVDNDCDSATPADPDDSADAPSWYRDGDGDGYGAGPAIQRCAAPEGHVSRAGDCADDEFDAAPDAPEACDGFDNDCDGLVDDDDDSLVASTRSDWYPDVDRDDHGDASAAPIAACWGPRGWVLDRTDCDDRDPTIHPAASEICDAPDADEDCDGRSDDDDPDVDPATQIVWYADADADGLGDPDHAIMQCDTPPGYVPNGADCDDGGASIGAASWYADADGDGYGDPESALACEGASGFVADASDCDDADAAIHPEAVDGAFDGVDSDCDGRDLIASLSDATKFSGEEGNARAGNALSWAGDVDGDGFDDVLVGAEQEGERGDKSGAAFLLSGPLTADGSLDDADAVLTGEASFDYAGSAVAGAGDVDADGFDDLLIGAYAESSAANKAGAAYLLLGPITGSVSLGVADARFTGEADYDYAGSAVAGAGDVNADGYADLLIGAASEDSVGSSAGAVYLMLGPVSGEASLGAADVKLTGETSSDRAGSAVAGAGDVDGDGFDDLLIAASGADGSDYDGAVYLVRGPLTADMGLESADAKRTAEDLHDSISAVAGAGDVDGDGHADVLIGSSLHGSAADDAGAAYLVLGPVSGEASLEAADAKLIGEGSDEHVGWSLSGAGDVDADGYADALIGAYGVDGSAGAAYLVLGPVSGTFGLSAADAGFDGEAEGDYAGHALAGGGDADGDGLPDLLVSAHREGDVSTGAVYLIGGALLGR